MLLPCRDPPLRETASDRPEISMPLKKYPFMDGHSLASPSAAALADDVEQGLALLDIYHVQGAAERRRQFRRVLDPLAIAARRGADLLEGRQFLEVDKGRPVAARRLALRVHAQGGAAHRAPHRVV